MMKLLHHYSILLYTVKMPLVFTAAKDDNGRRLDRILRKALKDTPLSAIHRLLRQGRVLVDSRPAVAGCRIHTGQIIEIKINDNDLSAAVAVADTAVEPEANVLKQHMLPEILYEGDGLLVLNKPSGLLVHGKSSSGGLNAGKGDRDNLESRVRSYLEGKIPASLSFRPGPLHRLDRMSSGVIVFSVNLEGAKRFSAMMREGRIKKYYLALVEGTIEKAEVWQDELERDHNNKKTILGTPGGKVKTGLAFVKPLAGNGRCTLILVEIKTGRTHQIRVQAASRGHPLPGDKKYGGKSFSFHGAAKDGDNTGAASERNVAKEKPSFGFLLHAWRIEIPGTEADESTGISPAIAVEAPIPLYFKKTIRNLFGGEVLKDL